MAGNNNAMAHIRENSDLFSRKEVVEAVRNRDTEVIMRVLNWVSSVKRTDSALIRHAWELLDVLLDCDWLKADEYLGAMSNLRQKSDLFIPRHRPGFAGHTDFRDDPKVNVWWKGIREWFKRDPTILRADSCIWEHGPQPKELDGVFVWLLIDTESASERLPFTQAWLDQALIVLQTSISAGEAHSRKWRRHSMDENQAAWVEVSESAIELANSDPWLGERIDAWMTVFFALLTPRHALPVTGHLLHNDHPRAQRLWETAAVGAIQQQLSAGESAFDVAREVLQQQIMVFRGRKLRQQFELELELEQSSKAS